MEIPLFAQSLDAWAPDDPDGPRVWSIAEDGQGAAFAALEPMFDDAWNMLFARFVRARQRRGVGRALLWKMERQVRMAGARPPLADTAGGEDQAPARAFYGFAGHRQVGCVPDYYGDGIDRISYARRVGDQARTRSHGSAAGFADARRAGPVAGPGPLC